MERKSAKNLLKRYVRSEKMLYHSYAAEAVMRAVAKKLGRNEDKWGLAGLLHDIDSEITNNDPQKHALVAAELLVDERLDDDIVDAIRMHNKEATGLERNTEFQHALAAAESISGFIYDTALINPDKKIKTVKPRSVIKKLKQCKCAAPVNRDCILECEKIGISLAKFVELSLDAMKKISEDIGL